MEVERLSLEMARDSLLSVMTSSTGTDMETMTKGVNSLKHWTWLSEATLVNDSKADPFTDDGLFDGKRGRLNVAVIGLHDGRRRVWRVQQRCCDGTRQVLRRPEHLYVLLESYGWCMTPKMFVAREGGRGRNA